MISPDDYREVVVDTWCASQVLKLKLKFELKLKLKLTVRCLKQKLSIKIITHCTLNHLHQLCHHHLHHHRSSLPSLLPSSRLCCATSTWQPSSGCSSKVGSLSSFVFWLSFKSRALPFPPSTTSPVPGHREAYPLPNHRMGWVSFLTTSTES